jgi:hypothetical protein
MVGSKPPQSTLSLQPDTSNASKFFRNSKMAASKEYFASIGSEVIVKGTSSLLSVPKRRAVRLDSHHRFD